tara:strand:+ start:75 stop:812 length:738 start_codon:yes stop_codon:yes gene_type:complete
MFDVDGTLTPSRRQMTNKFLEFFNCWSKRNKFYLVTGSDLPKMREQVKDIVLERADGLFTCCGNQFWKEGNTKHWPNDWKLIYDNKFKVSKKLKKLLRTIMSNSEYPHRYGNHIEDRGSLLNFSIVGRDCTQEQRDEYFEWDKKSCEREIITQTIKEKFSDLDAVIGGQISIDIYPKGNDKSQILDIINQDQIIKADEYIFIGDRIESGGNDYPLAKLMEETHNCSYYQTEGPEQTQKILESLID